jgi:hypothetical protein
VGVAEVFKGGRSVNKTFLLLFSLEICGVALSNGSALRVIHCTVLLVCVCDGKDAGEWYEFHLFFGPPLSLLSLCLLVSILLSVRIFLSLWTELSQTGMKI